MNVFKIFIPVILFFLTVHVSVAQNDVKIEADTLVGLVVNKKGKALKNISVSYSGKGVQQTNKNGIFVFPDVSLSDTLTIVLSKSRIWEIPVSGTPYLKIVALDQDYSIAEAKNEIINTGYGTVSKKNNASNEVSISGDELRKGGQTDLTRALIGKVAGLAVVRTDDGEQKLVIRGGAPSIQIQDNSALLIVDGMPVDNLDDVDIFRVEQVTVLKQASIYGMRGSNGAIVVKTN